MSSPALPADGRVRVVGEDLRAIASDDAISAMQALEQAASDAAISVAWPGASSRLLALAPRLGWAVVQPGAQAPVLTREKPSARAMRWIGASEQGPMRALFERIFGQPMSEAFWQWKYGQGRGVGLGLWVDGELVAHYGGTAREVLAFGERIRACQVCDVMVAPEARGTLARRGPLAIITASFLEHQIGDGQPHAIGFGFPSDRHQGVAERMKLYEAVDRVVRLDWPAIEGPLPWRWREQPLSWDELVPGSTASRSIDRLWRAMSRHFHDRAIAVRDAPWLRHRYGERPGASYEASWLVSRWSGRAAGLLITRRHADRLELLDVIAEPRHFAALVALARRQAARHGLPVVELWITASQQQLFAGVGFDTARVADLGIVVPANSHTPGMPPARFHNRWFLMSGDTDFR